MLRRALFESSGTSGEEIDESANRPEVGRQRPAPALVERCNQLLDGLAGDFFDLFVFHFSLLKQGVPHEVARFRDLACASGSYLTHIP